MQPGSSSCGDSESLESGIPTEVSGFVLAGGRSSRLGRDKALLPWPPNLSEEGNSQTLLGHAIAQLQSVCTTVSICANREDLSVAGAVIPDALPGSGPLGGIVAALEHSTTDWNLILAVDLPFLPIEVLRALVSRACFEKQSALHPRLLQTAACVLPELDGLPQPLCGVYHRALAPGLRAALTEGNFKVMSALREACDHSSAESELCVMRPFGIEMWDAGAFFEAAQPSARNPAEWFLNVNTPADWHQASQLGLR